MKMKFFTISILVACSAALYTVYAVNVPPPEPLASTPLSGGVRKVIIGGQVMGAVVDDGRWYRWVPSATTESRLKNVGPHTER